MKRLVEELYTFKGKVEDCENDYFISVQEKLRDYEKTDLYPNQIQDLLDFIRKHNGVVDEILKYKQLEEQGLLLRLPCKVGDTVYILSFEGVWRIIPHQVKTLGYILQLIENEAMGDFVFLTKEEAEQRLKEMDGE